MSIHASSFVRFAQSLGYKGTKKLQTLFQKRLSTAAPGFEARSKALKADLEDRGESSDLGFLRDMVLQDLGSIEAVMQDVRPRTSRPPRRPCAGPTRSSFRASSVPSPSQSCYATC